MVLKSKKGTMEHRYNKRTNADLNIIFYQDGRPVASGRMGNLSTGGVFIKTDYRPEGGKRYLEFACTPGNGNDLDEHYVNALIIHDTEEGLGLMVIGVGSQTESISWVQIQHKLQLLGRGMI